MHYLCRVAEAAWAAIVRDLTIEQLRAADPEILKAARLAAGTPAEADAVEALRASATEGLEALASAEAKLAAMGAQ